jgi:hypothetical protein
LRSSGFRTLLQLAFGLSSYIADMCDLSGTAMQQATQALLEADIVFGRNSKQQPRKPRDSGSPDRKRRVHPACSANTRHRHPAHVVPTDVHDYFAEMGRIDLIGHSGPLLGATKDIDISEAAVLAKLVVS